MHVFERTIAGHAKISMPLYKRRPRDLAYHNVAFTGSRSIPKPTRAFLKIADQNERTPPPEHRGGVHELLGPSYFFTRSMYAPDSVSMRTTVPISTKLGTLISAPVSTVAAFITLLLVSPFTAFSV